MTKKCQLDDHQHQSAILPVWRNTAATRTDVRMGSPGPTHNADTDQEAGVMKQDWLILRWALLTSLLSAGLGVTVNLATDLKTSWLAWLGVGVLAALTGIASFVVQRSWIRKTDTKSGGGAEGNDSAVNTVSGQVRGAVVQAGTVQGGVHIHHVGVRTLLIVMSANAAIVIAAVAVPNYIETSPRSASAASVTSADTAPSTAASGSGPLLVSASWPLTRGCDGGTAIAMVNGGPAIRTFAENGDERQQMINAGGGVWLRGDLYLDLSAKPHTSLRILNIRPVIDKIRLSPPTWIYDPGGGCGGPTGRNFTLNLDKPTLIDEGLEIPDGGTAPARYMRTDPIGPEFVVSAAQPATLRFDVSGCKANYQWKIEITYSVDGDPATHTYVTDVYRTLGLADDTTMYTLGASGSYITTGSINGPSPDNECLNR